MVIDPEPDDQCLSLDPLSSSLSNLDLLDTVLADFARGKLNSCDTKNLNVIEKTPYSCEDISDLEPLIEAIPDHDVDWVESGLKCLDGNSPVKEHKNDIGEQQSTLQMSYESTELIDGCLSSQVKDVNPYQSRLSDSFCDEIFTELEKTSTFPKQQINWIDGNTGESLLQKEVLSSKEAVEGLFDLNAIKEVDSCSILDFGSCSSENVSPQSTR